MAQKRAPPGEIDPKTLEYVQPKSESHPAQEDASKRNIVTVKKDQPAENKQESAKSQENKPSIFSNIFANGNAGVGLFSSIGPLSNAKEAGKEGPKINLASGSLFTGNGFNGAGNSSGSGSLFSGFKTGVQNKSSIFNFSTPSNIPPVRSGQVNSDSGDSADLEKAQKMEIDRSKSKVKYDYEEQVKVLFSGSVRKFKINCGDLMEGVEVVLQHDEKNDTFFLIVRLAATKHPIFTGFILKDKSEVRILNNKEESMQISAFAINKEKKMELNKVKLQLDTAENGKELKSKIKDVIEGKIVPPAPTEEKQKEAEKKEEGKAEVKETKE